MQKTVLIIAGPTASGKTSLAINLAKILGTEIISADSRQCFTELNIGVAKPSPAQLKEVPHYFISTHSIHSLISASVFEQYALAKANEIFNRKDLFVMAGGTGLYIRAFCDGMDLIPSVPPPIRKEIETQFQQKGIAWLQDELRSVDPEFFLKGEWKNPQRLMRALEVVRFSGQSILHFQQGQKINRPFSVLKIGLFPGKDELVRNINHRVDEMMKEGLLEEVRSLFPFHHLNALRTVGYSELFDYLAGKQTLDASIQLIKRNTWQYARRQMTWFRKDPEIRWFHPSDWEEIENFVQRSIESSKE